ncbi:MAG: transposase [Planctomycetaceae bacterium]|nr:transposase [Planctomycetaceae bacterium]
MVRGCVGRRVERFSGTITVEGAVRDIKANASKWLNERSFVNTRFEWQRGYGAFTVRHSQIDAVRRYVQTQAEHHRQRTFAEEYVELLERHAIEFDRRYLFEAEHHG